jgi:hypothetical protein
MKLTGRDIHDAYRAIRPRSSRSWRRLSKVAKRLYREMAWELNRQFEDDRVTIIAVRCSACGEMLQVAHCEGHACWLEQESYTVRSDWHDLQKEL